MLILGKIIESMYSSSRANYCMVLVLFGFYNQNTHEIRY